MELEEGDYLVPSAYAANLDNYELEKVWGTVVTQMQSIKATTFTKSRKGLGKRIVTKVKKVLKELEDSLETAETEKNEVSNKKRKAKMPGGTGKKKSE